MTDWKLYEAMAIVCHETSPEVVISEEMRKVLRDAKKGYKGFISGKTEASQDSWALMAQMIRAGRAHCEQGAIECRQRAAKNRELTICTERAARLSDPDDRCLDLVSAGDADRMMTSEALAKHVMDEMMKSKSFRCPWVGVASMVRDFAPGDVLVLAGYSGSGKTNVAMQLSVFSGYKTLYFGVDMTPKSFGARLWRSMWYRDNLGHPYVSERAECEAALYDAVMSRSMTIPEGILTYNGSTMSLVQIESIAREQMQTETWDILVIDYAGRVEMAGGVKEHWRADQDTARGIKGMASRLGIRVIALAQLNSSNEQGKKPQASWLSGSKELIAASDTVICLWHDWGKDGAGEPTRDQSFVNISDDIKSRNTGSNGNAKLNCYGLWLYEENHEE